MVLRDISVDEYIFMYHDYAREMVCCLVHSHLKDVLGHFHLKRHMQEPVYAMKGIECGQI